jgi:hypothetical protein
MPSRSVSLDAAALVPPVGFAYFLDPAARLIPGPALVAAQRACSPFVLPISD